MSFRVLALVSLVAVIAIAATAYLTFTQTSRQVNNSAAADRDTIELITHELTEYAHRHGTWEMISPTVLGLRERTGPCSCPVPSATGRRRARRHSGLSGTTDPASGSRPA